MADEPKQEDIEEKKHAAEGGEDGANGDGGDERQDGDKKSRLRLSPRKLAILAVPLLVLLGSGSYFAWGFVSSAGIAGSAGMPKPKVYYNLPEMVVNLSSQDKRAQYLKLKVSLEASDQKVIDALTPVMPRILDMFQLYLRELRSSDLEGSAGIYRLKEELLRRINLEIHPHSISRVLFNEIIIQ